MPIWTPSPDPGDAEHAHRILRTPADKPLKAIITSPDPTGTYTHYAAGRTTPCESPNHCENCEEGHGRRWHGYLGIMLISTLEHAIFEYTAPTAEVLAGYYRQHGTLRGCGITAQRPSRKPNGRVHIATQPVDLQKWLLPDPLDVHKLLSHIWGIPTTQTLLKRTNLLKGDAIVPKPNGAPKTKPPGRDRKRTQTN